MDASIDGNGAGSMTIKYRLTSNAQLSGAKLRMQSPSVTLVSATVDADKWATFEIKFDDVTKLSTIEFFENTQFALTKDEGGTQTFNAKFVNHNPAKLPDDMIAYLGNDVHLSLTLPSAVVKSNATTIAGKTATWVYALADFTNVTEIAWSATFKAP